jgi:hypothetical protein
MMVPNVMLITGPIKGETSIAATMLEAIKIKKTQINYTRRETKQQTINAIIAGKRKEDKSRRRDKS